MAINRFLRTTLKFPSADAIAKHLASNPNSSYLDKKITDVVATSLGNRKITRTQLGDVLLKSLPHMSHSNASNAYTDMMFALEGIKQKK